MKEPKKAMEFLGVSLTNPSIESVKKVLQKIRENEANLEEQQLQMLYDFVGKAVELSGDDSLQDEFNQSQKRSQTAITKMLKKLGSLESLSSKDKTKIVVETVKENEITRREENKGSFWLKAIGAVGTVAAAVLLASGESEHRKRKPTFTESMKGKKTR
mgnify:CR=1 FL=1